jgi:putative sugar O-methyltransferase
MSPYPAALPRADAELPNLRPMVEELERAPQVVRPSRFWEAFGRAHLEQLDRFGFAEFKRSVNRNYFQFLPTGPGFLRRDPTAGQRRYRAVLRDWMSHPTPAVTSARLADSFELPVQLEGEERFRRLKGRGYALYVAALWEYVRRHDGLDLLERLEEPALGHPVAISYRGRRISEDICNSVLEINRATQGLPSRRPGTRGVIELGSGYGRLAWAFLEAFDDIRYVLVDLPPALAIAERYLSELFGDRRVFGFRSFERYDHVREELTAADIVFLTPNQLDLLPPLDADLFITVSSLHEMRPEQIAHYFERMQTHCGGFVYTEQWETSVNPFDEIVVRRADYPVPPEWRVVFERPHSIQS